MTPHTGAHAVTELRRWDAALYHEGDLCMEAFCCTDLQATPVEILRWVVRRWSVEVTCEEARAHLGGETPRQRSDQAIARTTPVLLALVSIVTALALRLSQVITSRCR